MTYALPSQIRAARALINMSQNELAELAKIGVSTIRDFEIGRRQATDISIAAMCKELEIHGVIFLASTPGEGPGVRLIGESLRLIRPPKNKNTDSDTLSFDVSWNSKNYSVYLPIEILEDLDESPGGYGTDKELISSFNRNKKRIFEESLTAIHATRFDSLNRIRLRSRDFFPWPSDR